MARKDEETMIGAETAPDDAQQAAELRALELSAQGGEPESGAPGVEPAPDVPEVDPVESLGGLLSLAGMAAGAAGLKRTAEIWNPATCAGLAERVVPVLRKYPWGGRVLDFLQTGSGAEEVALMIYAAPLVVATVGAVRQDTAAKPDGQGGGTQGETVRQDTAAQPDGQGGGTQGGVVRLELVGGNEDE
jgi:hypothetical protein